MSFSQVIRDRIARRSLSSTNQQPNDSAKFLLALNCESLEPRMMLSTVELIASGVTNDESITLQVDGADVQTWDNVGGDAYGGQFVSLTYDTTDSITADQVRVQFTNDLYDEANGIDRNVRIDAIVIDGTRFETEDPSVYSTGTWLSEDGITPGFRQSEFLHTNGYFQFADGTNDGSIVEVVARGDEGTEQFNLLIDGQAVRTFATTDTDQTFTYQASDTLTADQVRIEFVNDQYDPANGIDANLVVDNIAIDGTTYETEAADVYSTGTWLSEDGIQPGFRLNERLHTAGYFQYGAQPVSQPGTFSLTLDALTIDENVGTLNMVVFRTGGADGQVSVDYETVSSTMDSNDYTPLSGTLVFADGETDAAITVTINDDLLQEADESFTLVLSNPVGGATLGSITQQTVTVTDNDQFAGGILFEDGFETGFNWTSDPNGTDQATTGQWEIGAPQATSLSGREVQLGSGSDGARALITGLSAGASVGANDIDSGVTTSLSPSIDLPNFEQLELSFDYYLAHSNNATSADYFSASIVANGSTTEVFRVDGQAADLAAAWKSATVDISAYSGQTIQLLFAAADDGTPSLVEAGVDEVIVEAVPAGPGVISIDTTVVNVEEAAGEAIVTVVRSGGREGAVSVSYATTAGTASNSDYTASSGVVNFADGQVEATITIAITDDNLEEQLETFNVLISAPTGGAVLGTDTSAAVTIVDNDNATADFLPDLVSIGSTLTEQLSIDTSEIPGRTLLRFASEVGNSGTGPLEIWGGAAGGSTQEVFQRIYQEGGGSRDLLAGEFVYHANHGHIHFEGFANYNLRTTDGSDTIVASGGKTSFCLINIRNPFPDATADAERVHGRGGNNCGQLQGLSVGYSDVYSASLDDQWIDITNVADGTYWLEVIADPDDAIVEADETNNAARVQITISNGQVSG